MASAFRFVLLFGALAAMAFAAAEPQLEFPRLDLTDGRSLKNVVIKTYDPKSDRLLLIADGKAMMIPRLLVPAPFAEPMKQVRRSGETANTISQPSSPPTIAPAVEQHQMAQPTPVPASANGSQVVQPTPAPRPRASNNTAARRATTSQAIAQAQAIELEAHRQIALDRARKYYRYEFRTGSDSALVMGVELELTPPKVVTGWEGRYCAEGKAHLEIYDSRGRSFQRRTSNFEVITERKTADNEIAVIDLTPKT